ncbi:MAG: helix-turn-helix domain-containing protein [Planctomycetes bacterium]|nr:helix-turn-helix domain-containing protein [Planctomycetota bacterium]
MTAQTTTPQPQGRNRYEPDQVSPPGETLLEVLNERGWSLPEFAERVGVTQAELNALIGGKAELKPVMARRLQEATGIPASFWLARQAGHAGKHS